MTISNIKTLLPKDCKIIDTRSMLPNDIMQIIREQKVNKHDIVCLINADVWRYGDDVLLQKFFSECGSTFLIFHMGYQHRKILGRIHEIPWPYFLFTRTKQTEKFIPKASALPWGFSCLNNKQNIHRLLFGYSLWRQRLESEIIFTQNNIDPDAVGGFHRVILDTMPDYKDFERLLPIRWSNEENKNISYSSDHSINHDAFSICYANIVTESEFESFYYPGVGINTPVITEKSFKPLMSGQIPLYLTARGHLSYMKYLGFETFDQLLPNDYDQLGTLSKIATLIDLIKQGKDFIESVYFDNLSAVRHNFDLIQSQQVDDIIIADTKLLIEKCLDT